MTRTHGSKGVILISAPWPLYSRPSMQLGALKAYLKKAYPDLNIESHAMYLKIAEAVGYRTYQAISEKTWLAEPVYAALLFPERIDRIEPVFDKEVRGIPELRGIVFNEYIKRVKHATDVYLEKIDWNRFGLAGFSISLCQLTATLYLIQFIKSKYPNLPVVVGGSTLSGWPDGYLKAFPNIDFIVAGEGEQPLARLVRHIIKGSQGKNIPDIPGVYPSIPTKKHLEPIFDQLPDINTLPFPDYDDYITLLHSFPEKKRFFPTLPVEMSRGCWWRHKIRKNEINGCAFCNLNLQWTGYRFKSESRIAGEIDGLTTRFHTLSVAFTDNLLPVTHNDDIFPEISKLKKDFRLFGEIRATTGYRTLEKMAHAGIHEVQIGIEALSTRLLKKIGKGTTAIQNLEILKNCEDLGITSTSNLILRFPGSDEQDVVETLRTLEFSLSFQPLRIVYFWLGIGSAVWENPERFGIRSTRNHPYYSALFPAHVCRSARFMMQSYRGDTGMQRKRWKPVKDRVEAWKKAYAALHTGSRHDPILGFRDGHNFLIIRQRRLNDAPMTHRLIGPSREIYLFCRHHRSLARISKHFSGFSEEKLLPFLRMMVDKRLMFEESGHYLSLAIPSRPRSR